MKISGAHKHWRGSKKIEQKKKLKKMMPEKGWCRHWLQKFYSNSWKCSALKKNRWPKKQKCFDRTGIKSSDNWSLSG